MNIRQKLLTKRFRLYIFSLAVLAAAVPAIVLWADSVANPGPAAAKASPAYSSAAVNVVKTPEGSPSSEECDKFAEYYNGTVLPLMDGTPSDPSVYAAQLSDALSGLLATVASATDPYSQTMAADVSALVEDDNLSTMGSFYGYLPDFLKACGMNDN